MTTTKKLNYLLKVGNRYPEMRTGQEIAQIGYNGSWTLAVGAPRITEGEVLDYRRGRIQMALTDVDALLFILYKFGSQPWCDPAVAFWF